MSHSPVSETILRHHRRQRDLYAKHKDMPQNLSTVVGSSTSAAGSSDSLCVPCVPTQPFLLPPMTLCSHCYARKFYKECRTFCCGDGQVKLALPEMPKELRAFYISDALIYVNFRKCCRTCNNQFAFTSFGVRYDKDLCKMNKGIYTFRVQGQVYHYIQDLSPAEKGPSYLQLYFYDTENEVDNRLKLSGRLDEGLVRNLIALLSLNPYAQFFRSLRDFASLSSLRIRIHNTPAIDQRVYNTPTASQVAAIWVDDCSSCDSVVRGINVVGVSGNSYRVHHYYGCYDPLQYPLLFPLGQSGWHEGIPRMDKRGNVPARVDVRLSLNNIISAAEVITQEDKVLSSGHRRSQVSVREYYCYKLQLRHLDLSFLLHTGRLLQKYVVDMYVKIETARLDFLRLNQRQLRSELYQGVVDSVDLGENRGDQIGKRIVLPASFTGGPRDNTKRYMDAMTLVQRFGKPDIFITMTCNPNWKEITDEIVYQDSSQKRPDLVARVFRAKLKELKEDLMKRKIFGPVAASIYVVEFQKRGLPHVHCLLILRADAKILTAAQIDRLVSCELPNEQTNAYLRARVVKHMMHGPCGSLNITNVCMRADGTCKNQYPKNFTEHTSLGNDSYALYKLTTSADPVKIRGHYLDNRWVVPYNPYLLAKFDCHLKVEICSSVKAVKYLYKYLYKGCDRVSFSVGNMDGHSSNIEEITAYQNARWISAPEAAWRIFEFPLAQNLPSVISLQLHLPDCQPITFKDTDDLSIILSDSFRRRSMLTEYFRMNQVNEKARTLLYRDFPVHFVWDIRTRCWITRQRRDVIGRIVSASPNEGERYYERLLLNHIRGATSFLNLRTVNSLCLPTFRLAASEYGLLNEDANSNLCLTEAVAYRFPSSLRHLFATVLLFCAPTNPKQLWLNFKTFMVEDFISRQMSLAVAEKKALLQINSILELSSKHINEYNLIDVRTHYSETDKFSALLDEENQSSCAGADMRQDISNLNFEQRIAFEAIYKSVIENTGGSYFIDGPGGTGKTFLYKVLLSAVRARNMVALATASSGVAASFLPGGRTAHSRFKLPLDITAISEASISKQYAVGMLLAAAKLIIWDEAPMMHKFNIEALDRLLQDVENNDMLFGRKVVVLGGDFRQILPVVPNGTRSDILTSSLVFSYLWPSFRRFSLVKNMRAQLDPDFARFVLSVGDGTLEDHCFGLIKLPETIVIPYEQETASLNTLLALVFPNNALNATDLHSLIDRVVLTPKNADVDIINNLLLERLEGDIVIYYSYDEVLDKTEESIHEDFLNTLTPNGIPPHELRLKKNYPVMRLCNINPPEGLCNGTRLICRNFQKHVIDIEIASGAYSGRRVFLPRIPFIPLETNRKYLPFKRTQFPVRPSFAMTINKAQGQTLDFVGIYLPAPVFSHGQLYVALSRARSSSAIRVLIKPNEDVTHSVHISCTKNVVYKEILAVTNTSYSDQHI